MIRAKLLDGLGTEFRGDAVELQTLCVRPPSACHARCRHCRTESAWTGNRQSILPRLPTFEWPPPPRPLPTISTAHRTSADPHRSSRRSSRCRISSPQPWCTAASASRKLPISITHRSCTSPSACEGIDADRRQAGSPSACVTVARRLSTIGPPLGSPENRLSIEQLTTEVRGLRAQRRAAVVGRCSACGGAHDSSPGRAAGCQRTAAALRLMPEASGSAQRRPE